VTDEIVDEVESVDDIGEVKDTNRVIAHGRCSSERTLTDQPDGREPANHHMCRPRMGRDVKE
jgi:hypothetical protein